MGLLLLRRITVLLIWFSSLTSADISGHSPARMTDFLLRDYAFKPLTNASTGVIYDVEVPANFTGIEISALRLRTGSLRIKGVRYKEFQIPAGVEEVPYVERLVLVYQNLGNWSSHFYELDGYSHLTPVLGLLAYNGSDLKTSSLPELEFRSPENPILVKFSDQKPAPRGSFPMCIRFDVHGFVSFSKVTLGNTCMTYSQGHFSIVVPSTESSTASATAPAPHPEPSRHDGEEMGCSTELLIVGAAIGGLVLVMCLIFFIFWALKLEQKNKTRCKEKAAEVGESVEMSRVITSKAPTTQHTRTQSTIESEHVS